MPASSALDGLCPTCLLSTAFVRPPLRILNRLGSGPASIAYLAEDPDDPARLVVLKKMTAAPGVSDVAARVAALRARCLTTTHRHIARVLELSLDDEGQPYAVTEFWPGMPVTRYLAVKGPDERLAAQVRDALAYAHSCGLVHGALTGTNVLVARTKEGPAVKILDFGHAHLLGRIAAATETDDLRAVDALL